jgi:metal-dependent hydrolase (beta-lactamase superfamily II)
VRNGQVTIYGKIDTAATVGTFSSESRDILGEQPYKTTTLLGFASTQRSDGRAYIDIQGTTPTRRGELLKMQLGNIVVAQCIGEELLSITEMGENESYIFAQDQAYRVIGNFHLKASKDKQVMKMTRTERESVMKQWKASK